MRFIREVAHTSHQEWSLGERRQAAVEEKRQSARSGVLATGSLACRRCDAPVAPGPLPLLLTDLLACPFCDERGVVRDFLSLAAPTRPARVVLRVRLRARPDTGR